MALLLFLCVSCVSTTEPEQVEFVQGGVFAEKPTFLLIQNSAIQDYDTASVATAPYAAPVWSLVFNHPDGSEGRLTWKDGLLVFGGDIHESAKIFFREYGTFCEKCQCE